MDVLNILLIEDDLEACQKFAQYTDELDDIFIVSITNNSSKALKDIYDYLPHAVILDLELHQGGGSGLEFLAGLNNMNLSVYPYILVTTNNSSKVTYEYARQLGADFIMSKHQDNYSEKYVIDFLRMIKSAIKNKSKSSTLNTLTPESPKMHYKHITNRIITELNLVGINPKSLGYKYLIDAIHIQIDNPTQNLCTFIGKKYGKTESSVERAMQNAINSAWKKTDIEDLLKHYTAKIHSDKGAPTITEFVSYYSYKIKSGF